MATKPEIERLAVVETKVDTVIEELKNLNQKFDNLDKKFAAKWVQSALSFVIGLIIAAVITALLALVIVPSVKDNTTTSTTSTTSTSTPATSTKSPSATATSNATATPSNPTATDSSTSGGVQVTLPKVQ